MASEYTILKNPLVGYFSLFQGAQDASGEYADERARKFFTGKFGYDFFSNGEKTILDYWDFKQVLAEFTEKFARGKFDSLIVIVQCHASVTGHIASPAGRYLCTVSELIQDKLKWAKDIPKFIAIDFCEDPMTGKDKLNQCLRGIKEAAEPVNPPLCLALSASKTHRFIDEFIGKHDSEKQSYFFIGPALKEIQIKSTRLINLKVYHAPSDLKLAVKRCESILSQKGHNDGKPNEGTTKLPFDKKPVKEWSPLDVNDWIGSFPDHIQRDFKILFSYQNGPSLLQIDWEKYSHYHSLREAIEMDLVGRISREDVSKKLDIKKNDDSKSLDGSGRESPSGTPNIFFQNNSSAKLLKNPLVGYFSLFQGKQDESGDYPDERARKFFVGKFGYDFFSNGQKTIMDDWDFKKRLKEFKEKFTGGTFDSLIVIIQCNATVTGHIASPGGRYLCTLSELIRDKLRWAKDIPKFVAIDFYEKSTKGKNKVETNVQRIKEAAEPVNPPLCLALSASKTYRFIDEFITKHGSMKQSFFPINAALQTNSTRPIILKMYNAPSDLNVAIKRPDSIHSDNSENEPKSGDKETVTQSTPLPAKPNGTTKNLQVNGKAGAPSRRQQTAPQSTQKGRTRFPFEKKPVKKWSQSDVNDWIQSFPDHLQRDFKMLFYSKNGLSLLQIDWEKYSHYHSLRETIEMDLVGRISKEESMKKPDMKENDDAKSSDTPDSAVEKEGGPNSSHKTMKRSTPATPIITNGEKKEGEGRMQVYFKIQSVKKWSQGDINDWIDSLPGKAKKSLRKLRDAGKFVENGPGLLKFDWEKHISESGTRKQIIASLRKYGYPQEAPKKTELDVDAFVKKWDGKTVKMSFKSMSPNEKKALALIFSAHPLTTISPKGFEKKSVNLWSKTDLQQWIATVPSEMKKVFTRIGSKNGSAFLSALRKINQNTNPNPNPNPTRSSISSPPKSILKGIRGLHNQGNTCYMNSALQALLNVHPFIQTCLKDGIITLPRHKRNGMTHEWIKLVNDIHSDSQTSAWSQWRDSLTPKGISKELRRISSDFGRGQQEDCFRVISMILSTIHEEITGNVSSKIKKIVRPENSAGWKEEMYPQFANLFWNQIMKKDASLIIQLFDGIECEVTTCLECGQSTRHFHLYRGLDLPVTTRENQVDLAKKIRSELAESKSSPELNSLMASEQIQFKVKAMFKGQVYDLSVLSIPRSNISHQVTKSIHECLQTNYNVKLNKNHSIELVLMDREMKVDPWTTTHNRSEFSRVITRSINESILNDTMNTDSPTQLVALIARSSKKLDSDRDYSYWNVVLVDPSNSKWSHKYNPSLVIPIHRPSHDTGEKLIEYVLGQFPDKMWMDAFGRREIYYSDLSIYLNEEWIEYEKTRHYRSNQLNRNQGTMYLCFRKKKSKKAIIAKIRQIIDKVNTSRPNASSPWIGQNPSQRFHSLVIRDGKVFDLPTLEVEWPKNPGKSVCMAIENQLKLGFGLEKSQRIDLLWMDMKDSSNLCQIVTESLTHDQMNESLDPVSSNHRLIANIWTPKIFVETRTLIDLNVIVCEIGVESPFTHHMFVATLAKNIRHIEQRVINQMPTEVFSSRDDGTSMRLYTISEYGLATQRFSLGSDMNNETIYAVFDNSGRFYSGQVRECIQNTVKSIRDQISSVSCRQQTIQSSSTNVSTILSREEPKETTLKNLNECLDAFEYTQVMGQDRRTYDCGVCKKRSKCVSWRKMLLTYPKILMIHFDRFKKYGKKDHLIKYPVTLKRWGKEYTLVSVCNHIGGTVHSGHYTAHVRAMCDQKWRLMNDSRVGNPIRGNPGSSKDAVVLIYVRS